MIKMPALVADSFRVRCCNESFQCMTGFRIEDVLDRHLEDLLGPEDALKIRQLLERDNEAGPDSQEGVCTTLILTLRGRDDRFLSWKADVTIVKNEAGFPVTFLLAGNRRMGDPGPEDCLGVIEDKYRILFETSHDAIMILDKEGFFDCNRKALEIFSCPSKERFVDFHPSDLSPPRQPDGTASVAAANAMIDLTLEKGYHTFNWMHQRLTGEPFPAEVRMSRFTLDGRLVVQAVVRDVTDRVRAEEEALKSERRFADIINFLPDPTFAVDLNGCVIAWNRAMEMLTGIVPENMLGKGHYEYALPFYKTRRPLLVDILLRKTPEETGKYRQAHWEKGSLFYENDEALEVGNQRRYLWSKASLIYDHNNRVVGAIQTIRDVTERKMMDLTVIESEKKFRTLFESSNDAIMMLDKKSFFDCNEKTLELYGFHSKDEFIQYHPGGVSPAFQPDGEVSVEKANRLIDTALENGFHAFTWIHKKTDGTLFPAEVVLSRFELRGRAVVQAVVRDITERVQAELALKRSKEELEVKTAYLEEANTALRVLLRRREEDKSDLEEDVLSNMRSLVLPYIERLKQGTLSPEQQAYLQVLESNLNSITSPFLRNISLAHFNLTGREIQIANLVKEGKTNKEISEMLNLSVRSVEFHRDNIRKKMKLDHRKANLRVFLLSLS